MTRRGFPTGRVPIGVWGLRDWVVVRPRLAVAAALLLVFSAVVAGVRVVQLRGAARPAPVVAVETGHVVTIGLADEIAPVGLRRGDVVDVVTVSDWPVWWIGKPAAPAGAVLARGTVVEVDTDRPFVVGISLRVDASAAAAAVLDAAARKSAALVVVGGRR